MMTAKSDLGTSMANVQDCSQLTLDVLTANINKVQGDEATQRRILEYFFHEHRPDCVLIQENPWAGESIKICVQPLGNYYDMRCMRVRKVERKTAILCRCTSSPKLDMSYVIELKAPLTSSPDYQGRSAAELFIQKATVVALTAKGNLATVASHSNDPHLILISWRGERDASERQKDETFKALLYFVNQLHDQTYTRGRPVPVVVGGDFNLCYEKAEEIMRKGNESKLQLVTYPVPSSRLGKPQADYFIITKDVQVVRAYAIPYEMDPDGHMFDHVPVMARLTFPNIKRRDDILVNNLEKMLIPQQPQTHCICNRCACGQQGLIHLLACRHTIHLHCLPPDRSCPICTSGGTSLDVPTAPLEILAPPFEVLPHVVLQPTTYMPGTVTCWHFFPSHCQSEIVQRKSMNCDVTITLTLCSLFFESCEIPDPHQHLSQSWVYRVIRAILIGSKINDRLYAATPLSIAAVIQILGLAFTSEVRGFEDGCDQKSVDWEKLSDVALEAVESPQTALLCMLEEKSFAFVRFEERVLLLDTHSHGNTGALVALASRGNVTRDTPGNVSKMISWFKDFDKPSDETVQVRRIRYSPDRPAVAAARLSSYEPPL